MFTSLRSLWSGSSTPASSSAPLPELTSDDLDNLERLSKSNPNAKIAAGSGKIVLDDRPVSLWAYFTGAASYKEKKESYKQGMQQARELLRDKFGNIAVERFDRHFAYRNRRENPLDVQAFCTFVLREKELQKNSFKMSSSVSGKSPALHELKSQLAQAPQQTDRIISSAKTPDAPAPTYSLQEAITWSGFSSKADAEAVRKGNQQGILEVRAMIEASLVKTCTVHGTKKIMASFDKQFAVTTQVKKEGEVQIETKVTTRELLKVEELSTFVDTTIKERVDYNSLVGRFEGLMDDICTAGCNTETDVQKFIEGKYHDLGMVAKAAIILQQTASAADPITLGLKAFITGGVVAEESDTQAILTAVMMHYIGTPTTKQPAVKSWFASAFTSLEHCVIP